MPRINFETTYSVNQSSLKQVQDSLKSLQKLTTIDIGKSSSGGGLNKTKEDLKEIKNTAKQVETALEKAFNKKLSSFNTDTFNKSLKEAGLTIDDVYSTFNKAGGQGQAAFAQLGNSVLKTNIQLKQSHKILDDIAQTLTNSVKWNLAASVVDRVSNSIKQAVGYTKALDTSLKDIRIVTNQSVEEMDAFAKSANDAAINLGRSTTDYTEAALIYYQQGLNAEETAARAEVTLKAANVTGQTGEQVSEQLTAV